MPRSQNAIFRGTADPDAEFDRPAGVSIIRLPGSKLPAAGWTVDEFDNWRDCGWLLPCSRNDQCLDLVVASYDGADSWMLQIAASRSPSFVSRWFGAIPSADAESIFSLARSVHSVLSSSGFSQIKWLWDGPPDKNDATDEPQPAGPP